MLLVASGFVCRVLQSQPSTLSIYRRSTQVPLIFAATFFFTRCFTTSSPLRPPRFAASLLQKFRAISHTEIFEKTDVFGMHLHPERLCTGEFQFVHRRPSILVLIASRTGFEKRRSIGLDFILNWGSILLRLYVGFMFIVFMAYLQGLRREDPLANGEQNDLALRDAVQATNVSNVPVLCLAKPEAGRLIIGTIALLTACTSSILIEIAFFDITRTGELLSRLSEDTQIIKNAATSNASEILTNLSTAFIGLGFMFATSWKLTLLALVVVPGISIAVREAGRYLREVSHKTQTAAAVVSSIAELTKCSRGENE
ncbi:hypothetical protein LXL04_000796 [Taraxacum kok-saghyz]